MGKTDLYPMIFHPIYKHYIWGGKNLRAMGKSIAEDETVAESWEISDHGDDLSVVRTGGLKGKTLRELIERWGEDICPRTATGRFPILIKYIDANRRLSVQVHPDDDYARTHEGPQELGKTECWYVLDAPPGAELVVGMKKGVTKQIFQRMISEDRIAEGLHTIPVSKGDFVYIKSGTVHAILEGIIICEIQENSDSTYRLYDWGRVGDDGKARPLHIDKALDVINFVPEDRYDRFMESIIIPYDHKASNHSHELVRGAYFNIDLLTYDHDIELDLGLSATAHGITVHGSAGQRPAGQRPAGQRPATPSHFNTLNILKGEGTLVWSGGELPFRMGETILVPRPVSEYRLITRGVTALRTFL